MLADRKASLLGSVVEEKQLENKLVETLDLDGECYEVVIKTGGENLYGRIHPNLRYFGLARCFVTPDIEDTELEEPKDILLLMGINQGKHGDFYIEESEETDSDGTLRGILIERDVCNGDYHPASVDRKLNEHLSKATIEESVAQFIRDLEKQTGLKMEPQKSNPYSS